MRTSGYYFSPGKPFSFGYYRYDLYSMRVYRREYYIESGIIHETNAVETINLYPLLFDTIEEVVEIYNKHWAEDKKYDPEEVKTKVALMELSK